MSDQSKSVETISQVDTSTSEEYPVFVHSKGDRLYQKRGRYKARQLYKSLGMCEVCQVSVAIDRHHKDSDTNNNHPSNIIKVCRKCHMKIDGRRTAPKACIVCNSPSKNTRKGRCHKCNEYFRRHGKEWSEEAVGPLPIRPCMNCGQPDKKNRLTYGRCHTCYEYRRRNKRDRNVKQERQDAQPVSESGTLPMVWDFNA